MKKLMVLTLTLLYALGLVGCANGNEIDTTEQTEELSSAQLTPEHNPQLPENLVQAQLNYEGLPLVTVSDETQLKNLHQLFVSAVILDYEPKNHNIGNGLNLILTAEDSQIVTIELDSDSDLCRINGEYVWYGKSDEPCYIPKLWEHLGIYAWPEFLYESCPNAFRPVT